MSLVAMKRSRSNSGNLSGPNTKRSRANVEEEDNSEGELEMDVDSDLIASQVLSQDEQEALMKSESMTGEAEVGVIEKVTLINFMCHKRLDISLSPNVNFILGRNGSGKSAIMTGIVVALGGNARSTERGKSLKQFIRSGEKSSEIKVHLRNRGVEAYRGDVYGDTIIVERVISSDGTGTNYKIKSSAGKTISTKKEELINVLDHCGIQVDNPVSLLNQDTSRHFLQKSKPGDKYKLFMKATHLEQIASDYERAEEDQRLMKEGIHRQKTLLPEYEAEAKRLEEKVNTFRRLIDMEGKVDQLEKELQWALVSEIQKGIPPIEQDIAKEQTRIPRNTSRLKKAKEDVLKLEAEHKKVSDQLGEIVKEASSLHTQREAMAIEKRKLDRSIQAINSQVSQKRREIKEKQNEKQCLETTRDECIAKSQRDIAGEKERRAKDLADLQGKLTQLGSEIATAENDKRQFDAAVKAELESLAEQRRKVQSLQDQLQSSEDQLARLRSSHNDRLATFGQKMKVLVAEIHKNQRRFKHQPIGPIGSKINLKNYTWAMAVEQVAKKSFLYSFIADNHVDAGHLKSLIRSVYKEAPRPDIIVSPFQDTVYDVRRNRPQCDYPTVLDMLDVQDPNVLNVLVDQLSVESILLIKRREEASRVIVRERPKGAKAAYTLEGDQVLQYAHYSNKQGKFGIIRESVEAAIRDEMRQLEELRGVFDRSQQEERQMRNHMDHNKRLVSEAVAKVKRKAAEKRYLMGKIEELRNAQEEEEPEEDIATYESEITELEEVISALEAEYNELGEKLKQVQQGKLENFQKCERCDKKVDQISAKIGKLKSEISDFAMKKREADKRVLYFQERIDAIQKDIDTLNAKIADNKKRAEAAAEAAERVCPRIATERSRQSIRSEIDKLKKCILQERPELSQQEEIETQYLEAMERFEKTQSTIADEEKALKKLQQSLDFRKENYCYLQDRIAFRTKVYFTHFLQQRDYEGKIIFNHEKERLEIEVQVDRHTNKSKETKNTKALSGGERSFTTVCFIMSLWDAMEAPFRCLDEFDVFMDMMNRRISMRLMLENAKQQPNRQFIFFTPQDMSAMGIKASETLKVLRLEAPERGQQTLNLRE